MGSAHQARGFTLAELLLILVIAGLLSAAAIPRYHAWLSENSRQQALNHIQQIATALEQRRQLGIEPAVVSRCALLINQQDSPYTYRCETLPDDHYRIRAYAPAIIGGDYAYSSDGRIVSVWGERIDDCWRLRADASCLSFPAMHSGGRS